jgi:hypothetical protein
MDWLLNECDPVLFETMYFTIMREYQMENLQSYDEDDRPSLTTLEQIKLAGEYNPVYPPDTDYYSPTDYFFELGAVLRDMNIKRRRESAAEVKKNRQQKSPMGM